MNCYGKPPLRHAKKGNSSDPTLPDGSVSIPNERKPGQYQQDTVHGFNEGNQDQNRYETEGNAEPVDYDDMEMQISSRQGFN